MEHCKTAKIYLQSALIAIIMLIVSCFTAPDGHAHPLNNGYSQLTIEGKNVHFQLFLPEPDLLKFDTNGDKELSGEELDAQKGPIASYLAEHIHLQNRGEEMAFSLASLQKIDREMIPGVQFQLEFQSQQAVDSLNIAYSALFDDADELHLNFTTIIEGTDMDQAVFDTLHRTYYFESLTKQSAFTVIWRYTLLGIEHILTGYDHMLFLLSLILVVTRISDILKIVTAFTIAHSITLFLAATGKVVYPSQWVEAAIALTIAYVAVENGFVVRARWRWLLTFFFGLIHGLGFASALKEIGLPARYFVRSLLVFNVGVEIGQLFIVALILPILFILRKKPWYRKFMLGTSFIVFVVAMYWLIERIKAMI
jgi:hypothetical protein